jgi:hypothetical protein
MVFLFAAGIISLAIVGAIIGPKPQLEKASFSMTTTKQPTDLAPNGIAF